jgi:hypothetical protein
MLKLSNAKKISIFLLFYLLCFHVVFAAAEQPQKNKVLLVVVDHGMFQTTQYQDVQKVIDEKLHEQFNSSKYHTIRDDHVLNKLYELSNDPDIDSPEKLRKSDFVTFGNKNDVDYIVFMEFKPTNTRLENIFTIVSQRVLNLEVLAKVVDVKADRYIYKGTVSSGTVSRLNVLMFSSKGPMWFDAVERCLTKFGQVCPEIPAVNNVVDKKNVVENDHL